jgi:phage terminase large subunit
MAEVYKPHAKQAEAHRAVQKNDRVMLHWGRQVGKTLWSVQHAWISAVHKQGRYFIVFRTYTQAKEVVWKQYIHMIPKELIYKVNNNDLSVTFNYIKGDLALPGLGWVHVEHDENKPRSSLQLLGSDQADSHRGFYAHGIIFDEYSRQNPEQWDVVYQPMFTTTDGWAIFMSTPYGYNHWYDMVEYAKDHPDEWGYIEATWRDNPIVKPEFIQKVRKEHEVRGRLSTFLQEYELEFRTVEGAVYPQFNRKVHMVKPEDVPTEGTIYAGIDFGWDNPTACVFVLVDYDDNWWVFDEIYARNTITTDLADIIRNKMAGRRIALMIGDSAQQESIATLQTQGLPVMPVSKSGSDSIPTGIALIAERLKPRMQIVGEPKPKLFVSSTCSHLIWEIEQYKYPEDKGKTNPNERPIKKDDHGPDALRYLALFMKYGKIEKEQPLVKQKFNEYGLL